jgi:leucyl aminopeptidase
MIDPNLNLAEPGAPSRTVAAVRPAELEAFVARRPAAQASFLRAIGFTAKAQELALLPAEDGGLDAVLGLGSDRSPFAFGGLAARLPGATAWRIEPGDFDAESATLGFLLGGYRPGPAKPGQSPPARLADAADHVRAQSQAAAIWMARNLVNAPANRLGPAELADVAVALAHRYGADPVRVSGDALTRAYPAVAAVGAGSARPPVVALFRWQGSRASADAPLVSLCGKGVCFDTGGYDLKPPAGMLRMKKDMGGAAAVLGLARNIMEADLPVRLCVRIGCVENSISGAAMRPLDVIATRRGLSVEIGNTDAEGRLVLCDLLAEASDESPSLLLDFATLTGAARVALGPDLPALFVNDDEFAGSLLAAATATHDPIWRMPLWDGYMPWLDSDMADMNNVSSKPHAGSVIAALFLRRFIAADVPWAHLDIYAWNEQGRPGRPEGGEAQGIRAAFAAIEAGFAPGAAS